MLFDKQDITPGAYKFQEKLRVHSDLENQGLEWWGESSHPHLSFDNGDMELDIEWYDEVEKLAPGLYVVVCDWGWGYESGEYGTVLSSWPEIVDLQFTRMEPHAWVWYWYERVKENAKSIWWWARQLFGKVWGVTESDGTIGHWICTKSWLYQAFWVWICAELDTGSKPMKEDRWFHKQPRVAYRIERDWWRA